MKAITIESHGPPEVIKIREIDDYPCPPNKIKVRVKSSSINHLDLWVRTGIKGLHVNFPRILGSDASGIIKDIGLDIKEFSIGDNVVIQPGVFDSKCKTVLDGRENFSPTYGILGETQDGVQSEYIIVDPVNVYPMPTNLSYSEAASMPLAFMTAYQMLVKRAQIQPDDVVLIYGATSGVGNAAIQIAREYGCRILSTVGSKEKINYIENTGCEQVFLHNENLYKNIKTYLGNRKIDIVFEHIGTSTWETSMKLLGVGGRVVTCGATTGANVKLNLSHLFIKQQTILGSTMSDMSAFKEVMKNIENGIYTPLIDEIFHFKDIIHAHRKIEKRKNIGKVVIDFS